MLSRNLLKQETIEDTLGLFVFRSRPTPADEGLYFENTLSNTGAACSNGRLRRNPEQETGLMSVVR